MNHSPRSKVARLIEQHNLGTIGDELERKWTRAHDRTSLRDLADQFNKELLRSELASHNQNPLDGEIDNLYRLLTDDDVTSGMHQQARNRLHQRGVDLKQLEDEFVSYQSIRTYLKNYRGASPPDTDPTPQAQRQTKLDTIQRLISRLSNVTERSLTELCNAGHLTLGEFNVIVTVRIHCTDCNTQRPISDLLSDGHCECATTE